MSLLLITRAFPYREEAGAEALIQNVNSGRGRLYIFPAEGMWVPYYRDPVPPLPEDVQVWNFPAVPRRRSLVLAWRLWRQAGTAKRSPRGAYRIARISLAVQAIVLAIGEPLRGEATGFPPAKEALAVARRAGWIG